MCCKKSGGTPTTAGVPQVGAPTPQSNVFMDTLATIAKQQNDKANNLYGPLEQQAVNQVQQFQTPEYMQEQEGLATAGVAKNFDAAKEQSTANMESMGVNPADGRFGFINRGLDTGEALGKAAASQGARDSTRRLAYDSLVGLSARANPTVASAISAAGAGGNQYNTAVGNVNDAQRIATQAEENRAAGNAAGAAGVGNFLGVLGGSLLSTLPIFSSKKAKTNRRLATGALEAARKMPVQTYQYKRGLGPPGERVGPMAEDMQAATGAGDGKTILPQDLMGVTLGAVQQLDKKVRKLESKHG